MLLPRNCHLYTLSTGFDVYWQSMVTLSPRDIINAIPEEEISGRPEEMEHRAYCRSGLIQ